MAGESKCLKGLEGRGSEERGTSQGERPDMGFKKAGVEGRERRLQAVGLLTLGERGRRQGKTRGFEAQMAGEQSRLRGLK